MGRPRFMGWRLARIALLVTSIGIIAACATTNDSPGSPATTGSSPSNAANSTVTVVRTGGFAGVNDRTVVTPDGHWTTTNRAGATRTGQLTAEQSAQLRALAGDRRLTTEATRTQGRSNCNDAFTFSVSIDRGPTVTFTDCPSDTDLPVAAKAIVTVLGTASALG